MRQLSTTQFLSSLLILLLLLSGAIATPARAQAQEITVDLVITSTTVDPHTGDVTVTGSVTCSEAATGFVTVELTQRVGRGSGATEVNCGPTRTSFTFTVEPNEGEFRPGRATMRAYADVYVCDLTTGCRSGSDSIIDKIIRLRSA
jgi:hypothetical protein